MELYIISPTQKKTLNISWLELNTPQGNYVIQPKHAPMILTLSAHQHVIYCLANGKQESFMVASGIAEITREHATLIINNG